MADTNYKPLIMMKIKQFIDEHPDYTMSQVLYCMFTHQKNPIELNKRSDVLGITDEQLYQGIDRALIKERE